MLKIAQIIFFFAFGIILNNISVCNASSCSSYSTESECETNSACSWVYRSSSYYCACASESPQDIYFVLDASGSVGTTGWSEETTFVSDMIESGVGNTSRVGLITFATSTYIKYNLTQTQHPRSVLTSAVSALSYSKGYTYTKDAVNAAITAFKKYATKGYDRLLLLITDGIPNPSSTQSPCGLKSTLDAQNITVVIVGVTSSFSSSAVSCLVDDSSTQIILVSSFSSFDLVRDYTDSFLCPTTLSLTLTEVRVQTDTTNNCEFIEIYNAGSSKVNFKTNPLKLSGLVSGTLNSSIHANLSSGQYLVLYKTGTSPYCYLCTCTDSNSNKRCDNALYIPCDGKNCTFNTLYKSKTANNTNWGVTIQDGSDNSYLVNVSYNSKTWPSITTGYSYELQSTSYDDTVGTNWAQSCWDYGTPGQAPLTTCSACSVSNCQLNGDTGASCTTSGSTSVCNCTEVKKYYSYASSCYRVPNATSCTTLITKDADGTLIYISWTDAVMSATHYYYVKYPYDSDTAGYATTASGTTFFAYYDTTVSTSSFTPLLRTVVPDNTSTLVLSGTKVVYGDWVKCPITTQSPTKAPTAAPTYGVPTIPKCNATISGTSYVSIQWSTPSFSYPTTPSSASSYKIYATCNGVNYTYYATSRVYSALISSCSPVSTSKLTSIKVVVVVNSANGTENDSLMRKYATSCTISTSAPTAVPTTVPTKAPSVKPTIGPTRVPTPAPTYEYWKITSCQVTVLQGGGSINISYTEQKPSDTSNPRTIQYFDKNTNASGALQGNPARVVISGVSITDTNRFVVYPLFLSAASGGSYIGKTCCNATCTVATIAPTPSPTSTPTSRPTDSPTNIPTTFPTGIPTSLPTPAPTYYGKLQITNCSYTLLQHNGIMEIGFNEPTGFSLDGLTTPTLGNSQYKISYNGGDEYQYIGAHSSGSYYVNNLTLTSSFNASSNVYVTVYYQSIKAVGDSVLCTRYTLAPTPAPTYAPTTPSPTYQQPSIYFDSTKFSSTCSYTSGDTAYCTISPSDIAYTLYVARSPSSFGYDVSFDWAIDLNSRRRLRANATDFEGAISGEPTITASSDNKQIQYTYTKHHNDSTTITFLIYLASCWVSDSSYDPSVYQYQCSVVNPSKVFVTVSSSQKLKTNVKKGALPTWIWYAIAAGLIIIPLLSYLGYRYYKKKQFADQLAQTKKQELKEAENLDDAGNFGAIGDDVRFNPLATGGTHDIASGGQYIDQQMAKQKNNNEIAEVETETTVYRQDAGQVQANRRK